MSLSSAHQKTSSSISLNGTRTEVVFQIVNVIFWGNDILGVLKVQGKSLDMQYLSQWAEKLNLADLLARAIEDAGVV